MKTVELTNEVIYFSYKQLKNTWANNVKCLWSEEVNYVFCFVNIVSNPVPRKSSFQMLLLCILEVSLLGIQKIVLVILRFVHVHFWALSIFGILSPYFPEEIRPRCHPGVFLNAKDQSGF